MPDITMCFAKECIKRNQCYRAITTPDRYQSYMDYSQFCENNNYSYMIPVEDKLSDEDIYDILVRC